MSRPTACKGGSNRLNGALPDLLSALPDELAYRVASSLSSNETACLRLVNKVAKARFSAPQHRIIHISKPVPSDIFARQFGSPGVMHSLTRKERYLLLKLVAGSGGDVANLVLLLQMTGLSCLFSRDVYHAAVAGGCLETCRILWRYDCGVHVESRNADGMHTAGMAGKAEICIWLHEEHGVAWEHFADVLTSSAASLRELRTCQRLHEYFGLPCIEVVMAAAARAGDLALCQSLWQAGCPCGKSVFKAAVQEGHTTVCTWLLENGCVSHFTAAAAAAEVGNTQLVTQLLDDEAAYDNCQTGWWNFVLPAAAEGCDMLTLQALFKRAVTSCTKAGRTFRMFFHIQSAILAAAASSLTPDWRAKTEWLLSEPGFCAAWDKMKLPIQHERSSSEAVEEAVARLTWLQETGLLKGYNGAGLKRLLHTAASKGDLAGVELLLDMGAGVEVTEGTVRAAVHHGQWAAVALQLLRRPGLCGSSALVVEITRLGPPVSLLEQLLERVRREVVLSPKVTEAAAESGSVILLAWLLEHGCRLSAVVFVSAVRGGCEEALEWLAAQGCDMGADGATYVEAARHGDLLILRCLDRLGCPRGGPDTFSRACCSGSPLAPLRWMVEKGFPVDWMHAEREARAGGTVRADVLQWLQGQGA